MKNHLHKKEEPIDQVIRMIREKEAPIDLTDLVMEVIYQNKTNRRGRKKMWRKITVSTAIAASAVMVIVGSGFVSPTMAGSLQQIPGIKSIFAFVDDLGLRTASEKKLAATPNVSVVRGDTTFTVPEIIYDGTRVSLSLVRTTQDNSDETGEKLNEDLSGYTLQINGRDIHEFAPKYGEIPRFFHPGASENSVILEFSDLRNQEGTPFPDSFILTLNLEVKPFEDPVVIHIPVEKTKQDIVDISPNETKTHGIYTITLERVELTPITTNITTHFVLPEGMRYDPLTNDLGYDVYDDEGNELRIVSGNGRGQANSSGMISDLRLEPFTTLPSKIIIKPYQNIYSDTEKGNYKYDEEGNVMKTYFPELEFEVEIEK
ncbi:DUF4179 domain-containing protein [Paenibacillus polygoni]|uniref:DUF4179 domain-containing protein n=1 Tax=Paenibacillus polygoni TaxID=3050112 RepID=A0ABY8X492_9BACL|nr:DUF4179 domain-containing protein [Paenibacillus polygoni]WIV19848.1 DUF4179 domain-containing protein [Paenibacillus polygoni]